MNDDTPFGFCSACGSAREPRTNSHNGTKFLGCINYRRKKDPCKRTADYEGYKIEQKFLAMAAERDQAFAEARHYSERYDALTKKLVAAEKKLEIVEASEKSFVDLACNRTKQLEALQADFDLLIKENDRLYSSISFLEEKLKREDEEPWSKHHPACVTCGKTDSKHKSKGVCTRCYDRKRYHATGADRRRARRARRA